MHQCYRYFQSRVTTSNVAGSLRPESMLSHMHMHMHTYTGCRSDQALPSSHYTRRKVHS